MHGAGQQGAPLHVVGAGLPSLPGVLAEARSYAERLFAYRAIGPLSAESASIAVTRPAELQGVQWQSGAIATVVEAADGYPYFLQEFANAWDYAPEPTIEESDAALGVQAGREKLDTGFFASRWSRATTAERDYLRAMAEDREGPFSSAEIGDLERRVCNRLGRSAPT